MTEFFMNNITYRCRNAQFLYASRHYVKGYRQKCGLGRWRKHKVRAMNQTHRKKGRIILISFMTIIFAVGTVIGSSVTGNRFHSLKLSPEFSYQTSSALYNLTYGEAGLSGGACWSVSIYNSTTGKTLMTNGSTSQYLAFKLPNGTYEYKDNPVPGYAFGQGTYPKGTLPVNKSTDYGIGHRWIPVFFVRLNSSPLFPGTWNTGIGIIGLLSMAGIAGLVTTYKVHHRRNRLRGFCD